jgi:arylsulfatase A-like enzyme
VHVPLAFHVPGRPPARRRDLAGLVDVFPTLLAQLGIDPPPLAPGRDLLAPDAETAGAARALYLSALRGTPVPRHALVADGHEYLVSEEAEGRRESLRRLGDSRDLAAEDPERLVRMRERLADLRAHLRLAPERRQQLSPVERERLRQLGYTVD